MPTIYKNGLVYGGSAGTANLIQATDVNGGTSNVQAELDKLNTLDFNPAINHNNIYRGITLVDTVENTGKYTLEQLHTLVTAGDFSDIYIGDIIKVNRAAVTYTLPNNTSTTDPAQIVEWVVMGINTYLHYGDGDANKINDFHLVLVPKNAFTQKAVMNTTNTTTGGYLNSVLWETILPSYENAISNCLNNHLLSYRCQSSNNMNSTAASPGYSGWVGATSGRSWHDVLIDLLTEQQITGCGVTSNLYDLSFGFSQLPGFKLNTQLFFKGTGRDGASSWFTKTIVSTTGWLAIDGYGFSASRDASTKAGLVVKVLFC